MLLAIAIGSSVVAVAMSIVAWRASRAERARSRARIEALTRAIDGDASDTLDLTLRTMQPDLLARPTSVLSGHQPGAVGSRLGLSLAAGAFVVTTAAAVAIVFSSESPTASANPAAGARPAASVDSVPLELISLDHDRDGDTLTIRGIVRNPSAVALDQLTAVVVAVGPDGAARTSVRSTVDASPLTAGAQSTFTVTIPGAAGVGRYRVSFRSGEQVVPHVDKRSGS